jgi:hypothetical protein
MNRNEREGDGLRGAFDNIVDAIFLRLHGLGGPAVRYPVRFRNVVRI